MFIDDIGPDYASDNLCGALFVYDGRVHRVRNIDGRVLLARDVEHGDDTEIPVSEVTGWRTFKYPRLGWRRVEDNTVVYLSRAARSYVRGISYDNVNVTLSDSSKRDYMDYRDLEEWDAHAYYKEDKWDAICKSAMLPTYDGKEEYARFKAGELNSFVPNHNFLMDRTSGVVNIYMSTQHIGYIAGGKTVTSPNNLKYINNMVSKYAA